MYKKISVFLTIALLLTAGWGYSQYRANVINTNLIENHYQAAFYNLVNDMKNLSLLTAKNNVAYSGAENSRLLAEIRMTANSALNSLSVLPLKHNTLSRTEKFLNQLGDYANTLCGCISKGENLNSAQRLGLEELSTQTAYLQNEIALLEKDMTANKLTFAPKATFLASNRNQQSDDTLWSTTFVNTNQQMSDYPTLIYEGAFSDHLLNRTAKGLSGAEISKAQALSIVKALPFLHKDVVYEFSEPVEVSKGTSILLYSFVVTKQDQSDPIYIDISKIGGKLMTMLNNREVNETAISKEQAIQKAQEFVQSQGYEDLAVTNTLQEDHTLQVELSSKNREVYCYSDKLKLKIALDDGEIVGFQGNEYWMNHCVRKIKQPKISETAAKSNLNPLFAVENTRLVLLPNDCGCEVLCYEFTGKYKEQPYLVYINAETGLEENIFQVFSDENGTRTL